MFVSVRLALAALLLSLVWSLAAQASTRGKQSPTRTTVLRLALSMGETSASYNQFSLAWADWFETDDSDVPGQHERRDRDQGCRVLHGISIERDPV